mmetsp:Transcript_39761/g.58083  ORF Transcript_39761/g.58083 Transcript_39761/m.58083 type:complete len:916 (+) Transcript_39761:1-2748(+)
MTFEMTAAIRSALPRLRRDAKVIILMSSLNHFHVGLNPAKTREWRNRPTCHIAADMKECYMGFVELATLGLPIIAILNGKVYGGGLPIALWCDYRIASADVDMHFGNLSRGMSPAGQLSQLLREYLSPSEIMEAYLENSHWDCDDLLRLKIVSSVASTKEQAFSEGRKLALFIARNPAQAVRDTLHLVKLKYAAEVANEESWLIAKKIAESQDLFSKNNDTFFFDSNVKRIPAKMHQSSQEWKTGSSRQRSSAYGIIAMEVYTPGFAISADTLESNGIRARRKQGQEAVAVWDSKEDSISMAMNAVTKLLERHITDPYSIGRLEVGTESNVDMAKSIKSYLMSLFPSDHVDIEGVDNINACYGGTAALLNTISWCRETGGYGIVVTTDTADMDISDSAWRGASAVAMYVGPDPWIEIHPERVSCFKNTMDFLKPRYSNQITPHMQTRESMNHYIEALDNCVESMGRKFSVDTSKLDAFIFHGGLCATFMKIVERHLVQIVNGRPKNWDMYFDYSRYFASHMGGLYTSSLFVNLLSFLHRMSEDVHQKHQITNTIGLFAYGSGSTATLMHATIHHDRGHTIDLSDMIEKRSLVSFDTLSEIVEGYKSEGNVDILPRSQALYYRYLPEGVSMNDSGRIYRRQMENEELKDKSLLVENHTASRYNGKLYKFLNLLRRDLRTQASAGLMTGWIWWVIASVLLSDFQTADLFTNATLVFTVTLCLNFGINLFFGRGNGWSYLLGHCLIGSMIFVAYAIILSTSRSEVKNVWRSLYFGWYTYDSLSFIVFWHDLPHRFRIFQSIHHSLSFLCTGTWLAVGGKWTDLTIIAVVVWLTSDLWHYLSSLYGLFSEVGVTRWSEAGYNLKLENLVFASYGIGIYIFVDDMSVLAWLILGTGLLFDAIDTYFRLLTWPRRLAKPPQ